MRYYLDECLSDDIAVITRNLGADTISCHGLQREGLLDEEQLLFAAHDDRVIVTINGGDFIDLTIRFSIEQLPHAGVLIVNRPVRRRDFAAVAHALVAYAREHPEGMQPYFYDFLKF